MTLLVGLTGIQTASAGPLVSTISTGFRYACALPTGGGVKCWGGINTTTPVDIPGLSSGVTQIAAGDLYTCVLTTGGGVKCWGYDLGPTPVDIPGLSSGIAAIAVGDYNACALTAGGGVKCWGVTFGSSPVDIPGLSSGIAAVAVGDQHACAVTTGGGVKCWGNNRYGQLGNGTTINSSIPVDVSGLSSGVTKITAGYNHTCAITTGGGVKCWGSNHYGQLGDAALTTSQAWTPVRVTKLSSGVAAISAGEFYTCAVTNAGGAKCWGANFDLTLGNGTTTDSFTPVDVSGLPQGVSAVSAGAVSACALTTAGAVKCWGTGSEGELGNGTLTSSSTPVQVAGLPGSPQITGFTPTGGGIGTTVTITGHNLNHATNVSFNGVVAPFTVMSNTSITATVPVGASTGKVKVITPGGTATSAANFTVT